MSRYVNTVYKGASYSWPSSFTNRTPLRVFSYDGPYDKKVMPASKLYRILQSGKIVWLTCLVYDPKDDKWIPHSFGLHLVGPRLLIIDINGEGILDARSDIYGKGSYMQQLFGIAAAHGKTWLYYRREAPEVHKKLMHYVKTTCSDPKGGCSQYITGYIFHMNGYLEPK